MLAAEGCRTDLNPVIGLPCESEPELPSAQTNKVAYLEFRGNTGIGALVLADGTLVALDFASGEIVFRSTSGQEKRIHRDSLPPEAREQFIELARRSATNPGRSFELGSRPSPTSTGFSVPFWGYPLRESMFRFSNPVHLKRGGEEDESPCSEPGSCRPPVMFERMQVTTISPVPESGRLIVRWTFQVQEQPVQNTLPQWFLDMDRKSWERWRSGRCDDTATLYIMVGASLATAGITCPAGWTGPPAIACAVSVVALALATSEYVEAVADCSSAYPGPTMWP